MRAPRRPRRGVSLRVDSGLLTSTGSWLVRLWERYQVELHGRFSIQRVALMRAFHRHTSWLRVLVVCLLTPAPALVTLMLVDCIPLASPSQGSTHNVAYWIRAFIATTLTIVGPVQHFRCCLPSLNMGYTQIIVVSIVGQTAGTILAFGLSLVIGFPVPFTLLVQSTLVLPTLIASFYLLWRSALRGNKQLQTDLTHQIFVLVGLATMIFSYPVYFFVFTSLDSSQQSAFTFALPLIKLGFKNYFSRTLRQLDDLKPAFMVVNTDIFNALYVANCLQASQSRLNTVIIMCIDIVQMAVSIYDVRVVMRGIRSIVRLEDFDGSLLDLCVIASSPLTVRKELDRQRSSLKTTAVPTSLVFARLQGSMVLPIPENVVAGSPSVANVQEAVVVARLDSTQRVRLVHKITKVLYIAEFLLLIEFGEVIVPVIYTIYLMGMSHLPNRAFYPQLALLDADHLTQSISTVLLNASLEFVSLIVAGCLLYRELKLSSPHLLAFALESQFELVTLSLTTWILYVNQQSLVHTGVDFSFRFTWLHTNNATDHKT